MYNHAPPHYRCPFCLIARGNEDEGLYSLHSDIVYHDETVTAFLGSHQWVNNPGNVLIIPNGHFENLYELPLAYATEIHRLARRLALAMKSVYACDGISTRQHNEPAGNQEVWHYHLHVTPRYTGDDFYSLYMTRRELMPPEDRAKHASRIRAGLEKGEESE